ncbi:MAG: hypothetical protein ACO3YY_00605, partial [Phycisphaerales bacterium]
VGLAPEIEIRDKEIAQFFHALGGTAVPFIQVGAGFIVAAFAAEEATPAISRAAHEKRVELATISLFLLH